MPCNSLHPAHQHRNPCAVVRVQTKSSAGLRLAATCKPLRARPGYALGRLGRSAPPSTAMQACTRRPTPRAGAQCTRSRGPKTRAPRLRMLAAFGTRACPGACGDSAHYLTACPVTDQTILDTHRPVTNLLQQLRLPKWSSLPTPVQLSILPGSTLPTIWKSNQAGRWHWTTTLTPHAALLALRIEQQLKMALPSNL